MQQIAMRQADCQDFPIRHPTTSTAMGLHLGKQQLLFGCISVSPFCSKCCFSATLNMVYRSDTLPFIKIIKEAEDDQNETLSIYT